MRQRKPWSLEGLLDPAAFPESTQTVELRETHISWVFLTDRFAYKIKKPVRYSFLDFSTLEARRRFCQREIDLNRRLSPSIYLGLSEVRWDGSRHTVDGAGKTVDYVVKMRRMPQDRGLDLLLESNGISPEDIKGLASVVASFHQTAASSAKITRLGGWDTIRRNVVANFADLRAIDRNCFRPETLDGLEAYCDAYLEERAKLWRQRAQQGRVRDSHGDLHAGQVYFVDGRWHILDCMEFNDRFRYADVACDVAFMAMDLEAFGHPELSRAFVEAYVKASGDAGVLDLLALYQVHLALVRAKVQAIRLKGETTASDVLRFRSAMERYAGLAQAYAKPPFLALIVVMGLAGTGKSTLAQGIARLWDADHVSSDVVRKTMAGIPVNESVVVAFGQGIYSPESTRRTYAALGAQVADALAKGRSVVADATFLRNDERGEMAALAQGSGAELYLVECAATASEVRRRLRAREKLGSISDARWQHHVQQKRLWEPVSSSLAEHTIHADTTGPQAKTLRRLLTALYRRVLQRSQVVDGSGIGTSHKTPMPFL